MTFRGKHPARTLACLLVVASFGWAFLVASAFHTDDGCAVELHCFACHWASASTGVIIPAITHVPALVKMGVVISFEVSLPIDVLAPTPSSRGPPPVA